MFILCVGRGVYTTKESYICTMQQRKGHKTPACARETFYCCYNFLISELKY